MNNTPDHFVIMKVKELSQYLRERIVNKYLGGYGYKKISKYLSVRTSEYRPGHCQEFPEKEDHGNITSIRPTSEAKPKDTY